MNFHGRKIIKLYFDTQKAATNACTLGISLYETDPFKKVSFIIFSKKVIDNDIKRYRLTKANRILKATNISPELD